MSKKYSSNVSYAINGVNRKRKPITVKEACRIKNKL